MFQNCDNSYLVCCRFWSTGIDVLGKAEIRVWVSIGRTRDDDDILFSKNKVSKAAFRRRLEQLSIDFKNEENIKTVRSTKR